MNGPEFHGQIGGNNVFVGNSVSGETINIHMQPEQSSTQPNLPTDLSKIRQNCAKSLAFPEMNNRYNDIDDAVQDTCDWIFHHRNYSAWENHHRGLLWIKGKPGSGKSTLLKYTLQKLEARFSENDATVLHFFFHGRGAELQKTPLGLFRSLLHQLLDQVPNEMESLLDTFMNKCNTIGTPYEDWEWHERELQDIFLFCLSKILETRPIWLLVDALDECGEDAAVGLVDCFKIWIDKLSSTFFVFKVCFSCRHYPILKLDGGLEIRLEKENGNDIAAFVDSKLFTFGAEALHSVRDVIIERACGVFMWAHLVVKRVLALERQGEGPGKIRLEIEQIPSDLYDLYTQIIRGMNQKADSRTLIEWVCFSHHPLTVEELCWAIAFGAEDWRPSLRQCEQMENFALDDETMERRIKTLSCGLVETSRTLTINDSGHNSHKVIVQFIHQSVKDFFMEKGLTALGPLDETPISKDLTWKLAHYNLSVICLRYLAIDEIAQFLREPGDDDTFSIESWGSMVADNGHDTFRNHRVEMKGKFRFLEYSVGSWIYHAKLSEDRNLQQNNLLKYLELPAERVLRSWLRNRKGSDSHLSTKYLIQNATILTTILSMIMMFHTLGRDGYIWRQSSDGYDKARIFSGMAGFEAVNQLLPNHGQITVPRDFQENEGFIGWRRWFRILRAPKRRVY